MSTFARQKKVSMLKKTKIIATISDLRCEVDFIREMYESGMNIVRLNTAHQSPESAEIIIKNIREVSENISILIDTKGPEVRTANFITPIEVKKGDMVFIDGKSNKHSKFPEISFNYSGYVNDINPGDRVLIDDGDIALTVIDKENDKLKCKVENNGIIKKNKSVNTPSVKINLPSLSRKDLDFIDFAIENNIDFIAHSFVRRKEDLMGIQKILDQKVVGLRSSLKLKTKKELIISMKYLSIHTGLWWHVAIWLLKYPNPAFL